jgi:PAS domain S-box-containing protein
MKDHGQNLKSPASGNHRPLRLALRYGSAVLTVAAGTLFRMVMTAWLGPGLPAFITFYPAVMVVALLAGFWPGVLATALASLIVGYWIMPPAGQFFVASPVDRLALALFGAMGLFLSIVAELYRRSRRKAAAYDQEQVLRETRLENEFLANLLEHASQPFAVGYPDGRLGRFNRAYEQLTGYSAAELRTLDWSVALTPPEWRERENQHLETLHRTGQPVRYEKEYVRKDGARVPIELFVHLARDAEGKPDYYYSFIADVTERRQGEEALRKSEEQYRLLFQANPNPMFVFDEETLHFLAVNDSAVSYYGWSRAEFLAMTALDIRPPEDRSLARDVIQRYRGAHEANIGAFRHCRKNGTVMDMEITISSISFAGRPGRLCSMNDVTERRRAEEALRESEQRFRLALRNAPVSVAVQDRAFRYIWAYNQRTARPEDIIGKFDGDIFTAEEAAHLDGLKRRVLEENLDIREQMWFDRPRGRIFLDVYLEPIHDEAGRVTGVGSTTVNLTPLKLADEALRRSAANLQSANAELRASRTAALNLMEDADRARKKAEETNEKLRREMTERERAEEALQKAHSELATQMEERTRELREKEVLLKEVHHRVKNNLQVISSLVGLQASGSNDETVREVLRDVTYRVRSMALVHEKLYQSSNLARIDFAEYARSLLGYLWRAQGAVAAAVRLTLDMEPISFSVDIAVPCGLILNELAGNALKHAFQGRPEGEVMITLKGADDGRVLLRVRDNGIGLPAGFDWREARSLGLRLVRMLAGQLDATVEVTGSEGTEFEIAFKY